jgi:hypothetical protein
MNKLKLHIAATMLVLTLSACEVHRDVSGNPSYWTLTEKGRKYQTLKPVYGHSQIYSEYLRGRQDLKLITGSPRRNDSNSRIIPVGTILEAQRVYVDSSPLQYHFISYHGVVRGGPLDGARVDFTSLLKNTNYGFGPDTNFLKPLQD